MDNHPPAPSGWNRKNIWQLPVAVIGLTLLVFLVIGLVPVCRRPASPAGQVAELARTMQQARAPTPPEPVYPRAWQQVAQWSGKSTKTTETFYIPCREWKLKWNTWAGDYGGMNFILRVENVAVDWDVNLAANVIGSDRDSTFLMGPGNFRVSIITSQPYTITASGYLEVYPTDSARAKPGAKKKYEGLFPPGP